MPDTWRKRDGRLLSTLRVAVLPDCAPRALVGLVGRALLAVQPLERPLHEQLQAAFARAAVAREGARTVRRWPPLQGRRAVAASSKLLSRSTAWSAPSEGIGGMAVPPPNAASLGPAAATARAACEACANPAAGGSAACQAALRL